MPARVKLTGHLEGDDPARRIAGQAIGSLWGDAEHLVEVARGPRFDR